eukprot:TRINITY_DN13561_c0_g1_i1.p1 TRINITY_DN13561_c0_g1~~TRINITY_DN13561_c0_g1_i1.p1  ORF type:complete len:363 (-),score=57.60 TRINITY_DN13561_c0_g1_i1:130-1218(-)
MSSKGQHDLHAAAARALVHRAGDTRACTPHGQPVMEVLAAHETGCGFPRHLSDMAVARSCPVVVVGAAEAELARYALSRNATFHLCDLSPWAGCGAGLACRLAAASDPERDMAALETRITERWRDPDAHEVVVLASLDAMWQNELGRPEWLLRASKAATPGGALQLVASVKDQALAGALELAGWTRVDVAPGISRSHILPALRPWPDQPLPVVAETAGRIGRRPLLGWVASCGSGSAAQLLRALHAARAKLRQLQEIRQKCAAALADGGLDEGQRARLALLQGHVEGVLAEETLEMAVTTDSSGCGRESVTDEAVTTGAEWLGVSEEVFCDRRLAEAKRTLLRITPLPVSYTHLTLPTKRIV